MAWQRLLPCPRSQNHVDGSRKHLEQFSVNLPGSPLREVWTDLKNGVHGREEIIGIQFLRPGEALVDLWIAGFKP